MDEKERAMQELVEEAVDQIMSKLPVHVLDDMAFAIIRDCPYMSRIQKLWLYGGDMVRRDSNSNASGRSELYQQIEDLYEQTWRIAEQQAIQLIANRLKEQHG